MAQEGKIVKLHRNLVSARSLHETPEKPQIVWDYLAERVRDERSKAQALVMVSREIFATFQVFHVGDILRFQVV